MSFLPAGGWLRVDLPVAPLPAPRATPVARGVARQPARYRHWLTKARKVALNQCALAGIYRPLEGPLILVARFLVMRLRSSKKHWPRGDYDNYAKTLDCLNGIAWVDDDQIVSGRADKLWLPPGEPQGRIEVYIRSAEDDPSADQAGAVPQVPWVRYPSRR